MFKEERDCPAGKGGGSVSVFAELPERRKFRSQTSRVAQGPCSSRAIRKEVWLEFHSLPPGL